MCTSTQHAQLNIGSSAAAAPSQAAARELDVDQLKARLDSLIVIDVREPSEVKDTPCSLAAQHSPLGQLIREAGPKSFPRDKALVFLCAEGERSSLAAQSLARHGYETFTLRGGIKALDSPTCAWYTPEFVVMLTTATELEKVTLALSVATASVKQGRRTALVLMADGPYAFRDPAAEVTTDAPTYDTLALGEPYKDGPTLVAAFKEAGGKIFACKSCTKYRKLDGLLRDFVDHTQAPEIVRMLCSAQGSVTF